MNKNDFEILSPTYKEKTEMKERLMREVAKEEKKPIWLEFSFYAKIAASLVLIVGVAVIIGLIASGGGTGIDISTPPASKPVISNSSSESEDSSSDTSSETESNLSSDTSSEKESIIESEPPISNTESNDSSVNSEDDPGSLGVPYVSDIGSFDRSGVLYEKPVIENEKIKIEVNNLCYKEETVMLSYLVTNKGSDELDIGTFTAGMGDYPDVFVNGYSYLGVIAYSEYVTTQLSKERLSHGETAEVAIEIRYDALLSVGITNVTELKTALYYGKRWDENEVDFEEYETACIEVKTSLYDEARKPEINYEEQLKNETVQEKMGYTFLRFIDTPFDEQNGIVIENAALLKTKSDIDGKEHYTVRLTVYNVTDNTVDFHTAVHVINDIATVSAGTNYPGNDIFAGERLILDVNTMSIDNLANYGITDIREIRLHNRIVNNSDEREEFYNEIVFSDEEDGAELPEELYNGNGVVITAGKIYEEYEHGKIVLLFDTAKSMKMFGFTGNACTINGKEFVIGNSSDEIQIGHGGWDTPIEGSVKKPFVLSVPMEMYDEIGITSVSEIEEVTLKLTIYNDDGTIADELVIKIKQ